MLAMRAPNCILFCLLPLLGVTGCSSLTKHGVKQPVVQETQLRLGQHAAFFPGETYDRVNERYLVFLPGDYFRKKKWPIILFLHGQKQCGHDLNEVRKHSLPKVVETRKDFPFIVISPQCLEDGFWSGDEEIQFLDALLAEVLACYRTDPERVYVTGLSMGGYGTWRLATEYPHRFAAIAPICGGGQPRKAGRIKDLPIWVFHREKDENVPLDASAKMVRALRRHGSDVRFTIYPGQGHDAWTPTYKDPKLYQWFLGHKRR